MKSVTYKFLKKIFEKYNIREDCKLMSDSGWECDPTDLGDILYSYEDNTMIFLQPGSLKYENDESLNRKYPGYTKIYSFEEE